MLNQRWVTRYHYSKSKAATGHAILRRTQWRRLLARIIPVVALVLVTFALLLWTRVDPRGSHRNTGPHEAKPQVIGPTSEGAFTIKDANGLEYEVQMAPRSSTQGTSSSQVEPGQKGTLNLSSDWRTPPASPSTPGP